MANKNKKRFPINYQYVSYEYFEDLYKSNIGFCCEARKVIHAIKKDYSLLLGSSIISSYLSRKAPYIKKSEPTKMSAKVQGLK